MGGARAVTAVSVAASWNCTHSAPGVRPIRASQGGLGRQGWAHSPPEAGAQLGVLAPRKRWPRALGMTAPPVHPLQRQHLFVILVYN